MLTSRVRDLTGLEFGRLTVDQFAGRDNQGNALWTCHCDCGNIKEIRGFSLTTGDIVSCGCFRLESVARSATTHNLSKHPLYKTWMNMMSRCYTRSSTGFENYGGRGISVCLEWRNDFTSFYNWALTNGYNPGLTLDRYPDMNGNYEPRNCRWASRTDQNRNTRRVALTMDKARAIRADRRLHSEIALDYGIDPSHVSDIKSHKVWKEE